ncbi:MAG: hypothetical protein ACLVL2_29280 [Bacteroides cellulosilyticus]
MEHASLVLMRERGDCCRMKMLGVEPVITDLALTSPFHVPQGQISVSQGQMAVSQGQAVNLPEQTAIPQAVTERHENAANRQETQSRPDCMPCAECTAMVTYLTPDMETQKHRSESATLYLDYPTGVYDVRREFHNNRPELEKLDSLMRPLIEGNLANISSISICGYASPDGYIRIMKYWLPTAHTVSRSICVPRMHRGTIFIKFLPYPKTGTDWWNFCNVAP